jgi:hypothetical protein
MQLLYVYIGGYIEVKDGPYAGDVSDEPFRVLKNIELNFSNKFIISYDDSEILDIKKNETHIPCFFDSDGHIKSVSAIIGKNGTGKTSIIELIKWLQPDNLHNVPYKLILIYGDVDLDTDQVFIILKNDELKLELSEQFSKSIEIKNFYRHNTGIIKGLKPFDYPHELDNLKQVFYSPVFEVKFSNLPAEHEVISTQNLTNISTSNLLENDAGDSINGSTNSLNAREVLVRHKMKDVERQYKLVSDNDDFKDILGFDKPKYIELIIDTSDYRFIKNQDFVIQFDSKFSSTETKFNPQTRNQFLYQMMKFSYYNLIRNIPINYNTESAFFEINNIINSIPRVNGKNDFKKWLEEFKSNCDLNNSNNSYLISNFIKRLDFILSFFILKEVDKRFRYADNIRCRLDLSKKDDLKILNNYFEFKSLTGFLHLDWKFNFHSNGELSSGQKAKFNLLSRFHSVFEKDKNLENLLILIDEGDTLFHPEWQRTYLNDLLKGLKLIFKNTSSIQIIFTTHSPFVTSDLPWYSIIKLDDNEENGLTKVIYNNDQPTFAANIHDLFADSFFMDKGFVGEFARVKINDLFYRISKISKEIDSNSLKKEIGLIGEPFVRHSLLNHLTSQINSNEQN